MPRCPKPRTAPLGAVHELIRSGEVVDPGARYLQTVSVQDRREIGEVVRLAVDGDLPKWASTQSVTEAPRPPIGRQQRIKEVGNVELRRRPGDVLVERLHELGTDVLPEQHRTRHVHVGGIIPREVSMDVVREVLVARQHLDREIEPGRLGELVSVPHDEVNVSVGVGSEILDRCHWVDPPIDRRRSALGGMTKPPALVAQAGGLGRHRVTAHERFARREGEVVAVVCARPASPPARRRDIGRSTCRGAGCCSACCRRTPDFTTPALTAFPGRSMTRLSRSPDASPDFATVAPYLWNAAVEAHDRGSR